MLRICTDPAKSPQTARRAAEIQASLPTYLLFTEKASSDLQLLCSSLTFQLEKSNQEKGIGSMLGFPCTILFVLSRGDL